MKHRIAVTLTALACLSAMGNAIADCAGPNLADKKRAYDRALTMEKAGKKEDALRSYAAAQGYACEPVNPYEADAAKRAAPLGLALGSAAEKSGDHKLAFELYSAGGHFAAADRALLAWTRANPDDPGVFAAARDELEGRALESFQSNNLAAISATGGYRPDPKLLAEVLSMPARGVERALQRDTVAFNEQYLRDYVQLVQTRSEDATDLAALQRSQAAALEFQQKWSQDPLKVSRAALRLARSWATATHDDALRAKLDEQQKQRVEQRANSLLQRFHGAPQFIDAAKDYYAGAGFDQEVIDARLAQIKGQANQLGDAANSRQRYLLASEYYGIADQDAKAQAARDMYQKLAMNKMQPSIDAAQRQAEQLQREFSDPQKVQAMREQAEAMRKSLQQQQQANAKGNAKRAADLESELGL